MRLKDFDYAEPVAYFVTICSRVRTEPFGGIGIPSELGQLVSRYWNEIPIRDPRVLLDESVVMPDHLHGILFTNGARLPIVVSGFKSAVTKAWGAPVWQRSYFDRILTATKDIDLARRYIVENPARWLQKRGLELPATKADR
jgi:putative transposase